MTTPPLNLDPALESVALHTACGSPDTAVQTAGYHTLWHYLYRVAAAMTHSQPDGDALAQDYAQRALLRVHQQYARCDEPKAFRVWARRIACNLVIDELRRRQRLQPLPESGPVLTQPARLESEVLGEITAVSLRQLLTQAPISDRSRRVVIGRYLDDANDETLALTESELSNSEVLPSHVQVTRAKNIAKLRQWPLLAQFLDETRS